MLRYINRKRCILKPITDLIDYYEFVVVNYIHVCVSVCLCVHTHLCTQTYVYLYISVHMYMYVCMYICVCKYICEHARTHTHTDT